MSRKNSVLVIAFLLLLSAQCAFSQKQNQIGTWKMYMPYGVSLGVCDAGSVVYSAAHQSLFSYEKSSGVIQTYDKSTGLSDVNLQGIYYDPTTQVLAVAYLDANIDLISSGTTIYNLPDLEEEGSIEGVTINSISFYQGNAYVSTNIGISVIGLSNPQINNTYIIGSTGSSTGVYSTSFDSVNIYAATDQGVKYAPLNSPNLLDFHSWSTFGPAQNLPASKASLVASYNKNLYAVIDNGVTDTLYEYNGSNWTKRFYDSLNIIESLNPVNGSLYMGILNNLNSSGNLGKIGLNDSLVILPTVGGIRPFNWFESNGVSYDADLYNGLFTSDHGLIIPEGPYSAAVFRMNIQNHILYVAPGGVDDSWDYEYNRDGFFIYQNNTWLYRNANTDPNLANYTDILCTATIPALGTTFFGSFFSGLIEYNNASGNLTYLNKDNSIFEGAIGDSSRTKISCMTLDQYNNLWVGNAGAPSLIKALRLSDTTWHKFSLPYTISLLENMIVDENNQVWAVTRQTDGVVVFGYGTDMDVPSGFSYKFLTTGTGTGGLPDVTTYCLTEDLNGNIWVGTDQGIGIYYCASNVLQPGSCDAQQIKVVAPDGYVAYLFGSESVRALAVDPAGRIWVGTTNGAWLISDDGQTQYLNFNSSNSPMPANQVTDIKVDYETGEVFIGTIGGLVSYQGDAIGTCSDCNTACVYPNPVRPGYTGPIAIKCLTDNAYVKILDASGTLIYQGTANGTQMIWNGASYNGTRAKSGVYLVFSSDALGQSKQVAKILLMN